MIPSQSIRWFDCSLKCLTYCFNYLFLCFKQNFQFDRRAISRVFNWLLFIVSLGPAQHWNRSRGERRGVRQSLFRLNDRLIDQYAGTYAPIPTQRPKRVPMPTQRQIQRPLRGSMKTQRQTQRPARGVQLFFVHSFGNAMFRIAR